MLLHFNHKKFFLKCKLPLLALIKLKGNNFTHYYLPLIYRMNNFNIVYKFKKEKTVKVVWWIVCKRHMFQ